ncbi:MAG: aminotransferase class I/II-fold pyridoxal phosphate-dependent enzyme [Ruminococcus sp.]|uniref:aminotransferase class I/II-fold pyridoxal phosphate-dependent enzyme n=1 Tax=Ruminococcus sp. TaxID=41978 RepID=UPI002873CBDB|nr:aminotransferase class I/II-fold pyridoxal phosphate-dependent enzyme [Ruminococcus sp.]MBQ3286246.1 aminotransferase class I/II-fold pyridoxal phosphate-dependent enzyme [Ruminococcus sp.]
MKYKEFSREQRDAELSVLWNDLNQIKEQGLQLNMARGVPSPDQLSLSLGMLNVLYAEADCRASDGTDCRNYGVMDGIPECKCMMAELMGVKPEMVMTGGNSSLNMMFDTISCFMNHPVLPGNPPWSLVPDRKFLCPVPGYDRHFGVTEYFGFEMIPVMMDDNGPDMDKVEELVKDPAVKGMWCVPKYSNPTGISYSDEVVRRIAALRPAAPDFRVMWDNAYCIHDLTDEPDEILNIFEECEKTGNIDLPITFCSTSKITFPGSGVAAMAASENNMRVIKEKYKYQTIGYDKLNMLRHVRFFGDMDGMRAHMKKHAEVLRPRFEIVLKKLHEQLEDYGIVWYNHPRGGYFVSVNVLDGTAKRVVELCKDAGVILTGAGATYPYGKDPFDSNIRIAPSFPSLEDLSSAMDVFCICARIAALEKMNDLI